MVQLTISPHVHPLLQRFAATRPILLSIDLTGLTIINRSPHLLSLLNMLLGPLLVQTVLRVSFIIVVAHCFFLLRFVSVLIEIIFTSDIATFICAYIFMIHLWSHKKASLQPPANVRKTGVTSSHAAHPAAIVNLSARCSFASLRPQSKIPSTATYEFLSTRQIKQRQQTLAHHIAKNSTCRP